MTIALTTVRTRELASSLAALFERDSRIAKRLTWISGAFIRPCFSGFGSGWREAEAELASVPPGDFDGQLVVAGVEQDRCVGSGA
jgi:hypothetical protein